MHPTIFDIETAPLHPAALAQFIPPFPAIEPFDPASVKTGEIDRKTKTPPEEREKLKQEKIDAARAAHEKKYVDDKAKYEAEAHGKAALSPVTGTVLAIGCYKPSLDSYLIVGVDEQMDEATLLDAFWTFATSQIEQNALLIGLNIFNFDLPFLVRRSWMLGVNVPRTIRDGRYWSRSFVDLAECWLCGQRFGSVEASFSAIAKALGLPDKPEGVTGADFARLWGEDREAAVAYLKNDLLTPAKMAMRMGVIEDYGIKRQGIAEDATQPPRENVAGSRPDGQ